MVRVSQKDGHFMSSNAVLCWKGSAVTNGMSNQRAVIASQVSIHRWATEFNAFSWDSMGRCWQSVALTVADIIHRFS
jgi:hypothetical protein